MELAAALCSEHLVEAVCPVNTHQAHHGQIDTQTDTCRALHVEGIELLGFCPSVTCLGESQSIDGGVAKEERIAELKGETVVSIALGTVWSERTVLITAQSDGLFGIACRIARHSVTTHIVGFKRRLLVFVVTAQDTQFHASHQHQTLGSSGQCGIGTALELPLVILHPTVTLLLGSAGSIGQPAGCLDFRRINVVETLVVFAVERRPWRRDGNTSHELRTAAREELVIGRSTRERHAQVQVVTVTVLHQEVAPLFQHIAGVGQLYAELEIVVGPAQTLSPSKTGTKELDILVGVVIVLVAVIIARTDTTIHI